MGDGGQSIETSSHKMNKLQGNDLHHGDYTVLYI